MPYAYIKISRSREAIMKLIINNQKVQGPQEIRGAPRSQGPQGAQGPQDDVKDVSTTGVNNSLFRKSLFDTKNYYFYYTEVWKEKYGPKY